MATILTKKSDTASAVPLAGDLTNSTGGAELAVNTADKRLFTKTSGGTVVEVGTNPSTIDINAGTIDGTAIGASSASTGAFTTLSASSTVTLSGGTANGVLYLNGSKVATSGSALTFDGTLLRSSTYLGLSTNTTPDTSTGDAIFYKASAGATLSGFNLVFETGSAGSRSEQMRLTSTGLGIGTSSPGYKLDVAGTVRISNGGDSYFGFGANKDNYFTTGTTSGKQVWRSSSGSEFMTLDSSGNSLLGTTSTSGSLSNYAASVVGQSYTYRAFFGATTAGTNCDVTGIPIGSYLVTVTSGGTYHSRATYWVGAYDTADYGYGTLGSSGYGAAQTVTVIGVAYNNCTFRVSFGNNVSDVTITFLRLG